MTKKPDAEELRRRADAILAERRRSRAGDPPPDTDRLLHELQVHQIELELQNEELAQARLEAEEGLARYTDLFEYAPVGYFTVNRQTEIQQVNLTGARLLGLDRSELVGTRLTPLVANESRSVFGAFLQDVFGGSSKEVCEVRLASGGAEAISLELVGVASPLGAECGLSATDISARKRAERLHASLVESESTERIAGVVHELRIPLVTVNESLRGLAEDLAALSSALDAARLAAMTDRLTDATAGAKRLAEISRALTSSLDLRAARPDPSIRGRILVVDDEPALRKVLRRLLGKAHDVVTASSGKDAKALLEADMSFDLILSDLMMPEMNGIEFHAWLSTANPRLARRTAFISGGTFTKGANEYLASVPNMVIDKPFDGPDLVRLVSEMVAAARRSTST